MLLSESSPDFWRMARYEGKTLQVYIFLLNIYTVIYETFIFKMLLFKKYTFPL